MYINFTNFILLINVEVKKKQVMQKYNLWFQLFKFKYKKNYKNVFGIIIIYL